MKLNNITNGIKKMEKSVVRNYSDILENGTIPKIPGMDEIILYYINGVIMCLITIAGAAENGMVMFVFHANNKLHTTTNVFITFLCFCNFMISVISISSTAISFMLNRWLLGDFGCTIHAFVMTSFGMSSIMTLVAISYERYAIIVKQSKFIPKRTHGHRFVAGCFIFGNLCAIPPLLGWNSYTEDGNMFFCSIDWKSKDLWNASYSVSLFIIGFILPFTSITLFYLKILRKIKHFSKRSSLRGRKIFQMQREVKIVTTTLLILGAFAASWLPYSIYVLWTHFGSIDWLPMIGHYIPLLMAKASVIWNPIIYTYKDKHFRKVLLKTFPCFNCYSSFRKENKSKTTYNRKTIEVLQ